MALPSGVKDFSLAGKHALVIGAEHPLGRVAAVTLAEAGAKVMIASQEAGTADALNETALLLRTPANARRLLESLAQARSDQREEHELS